jgi:hypothetical protein
MMARHTKFSSYDFFGLFKYFKLFIFIMTKMCRQVGNGLEGGLGCPG